MLFLTAYRLVKTIIYHTEKRVLNFMFKQGNAFYRTERTIPAIPSGKVLKDKVLQLLFKK